MDGANRSVCAMWGGGCSNRYILLQFMGLTKTVATQHIRPLHIYIYIKAVVWPKHTKHKERLLGLLLDMVPLFYGLMQRWSRCEAFYGMGRNITKRLSTMPITIKKWKQKQKNHNRKLLVVLLLLTYITSSIYGSTPRHSGES